MSELPGIFQTYKERLSLLLALMNLRQETKILPDEHPGNEEIEIFERELREKIQSKEPGASADEDHALTGAAKLFTAVKDANLSNAALDAYMLFLLMDEMPGFRRLCERTVGSAYPDLNQRRFIEDLLFEYHGMEARDCFQDSSPLFQSGLLQYNEDCKGVLPMDRTILLNRFISDPFFDRPKSHAWLHYRETAFVDNIPYQDQETLEAICSNLELTRKEMSSAIHQIYGPSGSGKRRLARYACSRTGLSVIEINLRELLFESHVKDLLRGAIRAAIFQKQAVVIGNAEVLGEEKNIEALNFLQQELTRPGLTAFLISEKKLHITTSIGKLTTLELNPPDRKIRERIWSEILADYETAADVSALELARLFHLTGKSIRSALREAEGVAAGFKEITRGQILRICRSKSTSRLSELAFLVEPKFGWDDLILPASSMHLVREIEADVRADARIFGEWYMDKASTAAKGHNILFTGIPGTGKTMAASIIASELGVELYKVDLSRVTSKYVGEVEKNLASLFDEAEKANAALFFDEADSLFGKRSEKQQGAQEHYVNQQVGFLLQKLESFQGITFMATNLPDNMDKAYQRRFNYVVPFKFPNDKERARIWKRAFSRETPIADDINFDLLGHELTATGAHIKSMALRAARRAAADEVRNPSVVTLFDIIYAAVREFDKVQPGWDTGGPSPFRDHFSRVRDLLKGEESSPLD